MKQIQETKSRFKILKGGKIALIITTLLGSITLSIASPTDGVVTSGSATISQVANTTNINQSTSKATINWNTFNIASNETVNFIQPDINSITLNRVTGNETSIINGALNATGQVWILNSNGVLFGKNAQVNTSGLLATTKNLSDTDFNNNNYTLKGDSTASVLNLGEITINNDGYTTLIANSVTNEGTITAVKGRIHLVGANEVTINFNGNSLVSLTVDKGVLDSIVKNTGSLYANAGEIYLTTNAVNDLLKGVVNNTGIIEAQSLEDVTGKIELFAHGGEVQVGGTLKANDGFIETSGKEFTIAENTNIQTGLWLIDPTDITIDATLASALQTQLASGDAEVTTVSAGSDTGNIDVNSDITWSSESKLTLTADNDINVNATIENTNSSDGGVFFNARNDSDAVVFGANGLVKINNVYQLQWINTALTGKYELASEIDASETSTWNSGTGFDPIGPTTDTFSGSFDGKGNVISSLFINRPTTSGIGLFGGIRSSSSIQNVGLIDVDITGHERTGGLVGWSESTIANSYVTGAVSGAGYVGGLVGWNFIGSITNSYATGTVSGTSPVGGLVGNSNGSITNSYATGTVSGTSPVGGLVGWNTGFITNSFWDTQTTGQQQTNLYTGTGLTTAQMKDTKTFFDAGWDFDTVWGRDTNNVENNGYLGLRALSDFSFNTVLSATVAGQTKVYNGTADITTTLSKANIIDTVSFTGNENVGVYAFTSISGDYGLTYATGFNSGNTEVVIEKSGSATITQKALTLSAITASNKVYDASTTATVSATLSGLIGGDSVSIASTFDNKNVGTGKTVTLNSLAGADGANYSIVAGQTTTADVTQKALTLSAITASNKVYDASTTATTTATLSGVIAGDTVSNSIASTFDDKNVGTVKTVTLDSVALAGTDAANYSIVAGQTTSADVTKKALTLSAITGNNKVYDATTTATVSATLGGLVGGDSVSIASTFDNKNVGIAKTVTLNSLAGTDAGNYSIVSGQTTTADVTKKALILSAITGNNKIYDATTTATVNATLSGLVGGDSVSIASTFDDKNVGTGKTVTLNTLAGADGANYFATLGQTTTADITSSTSPKLENVISSVTILNLPQITPRVAPRSEPKAFALPSQGDSLIAVYDGFPLFRINAGVNLPHGLKQQIFTEDNPNNELWRIRLISEYP